MTDLSVAEPAARTGAARPAGTPAAGHPAPRDPEAGPGAIRPGRRAARAAGDRRALARRGLPLLHLHLTDRAAGLGQLLEATP